MASSVKVGDKAPDFTLPAQSGEPVRLQDRLGERVVVLYFYPKDNTSGCTAEACAFRDSHEVFTDAGAEVIGVSSDSADKHTAFADKYKLPFTLLSDRGGKVRKLYGVPTVLGLIPWPGHLRDRPRGHRPADFQLDDQHQRARQRRARDGQAVAGVSDAAGLLNVRR